MIRQLSSGINLSFYLLSMQSMRHKKRCFIKKLKNASLISPERQLRFGVFLFAQHRRYKGSGDLVLIRALLKTGVKVRAYDLEAMNACKAVLGTSSIEYCEEP